MKTKNSDSNELQGNMTKKELDWITKKLLNGFGESLIRDGFIKIEGKTPDQLHEEIWNILINTKIQNVATNHTDNLLKSARSYEGNKNWELACLFYALWFEHWLNWLIVSVCKRKGFSEKLVTQIIRDTDISRGKSTWLLKLLNIPSINQRHLVKMYKIMELRNSYVHYKWQLSDIDADRNSEHRVALLDIQKTISYFKKYEHKVLFGKLKKSDLKLIPTKR